MADQEFALPPIESVIAMSMQAAMNGDYEGARTYLDIATFMRDLEATRSLTFEKIRQEESRKASP